MVSKALGLIGGAGLSVGYLERTSDSNSWWSSLTFVRFSRAAIAAFVVSLDYKWSLSSLKKTEYNEMKSHVHHRSAKRLLRMCRKNGGCYIKIGQHIGSLEYLLPPEYVQTFKVFHSNAPQTPLDRLGKVIQEELNISASALLTDFEEEPLGAASLAQCHKAVLKETGEVVAVKIQHPGVMKNALTDMATVDFLVYCASKVFPSFQFGWLADGVRKNLPQELDFRIEAQNMDKCSQLFNSNNINFVKIPKVHIATKRLLVMEYCEGGKINDIQYIKDNKLSVNEISLCVSEMYSRMIYSLGFMHCDPHPGNVLVRKKEGVRGGGGRGNVEIVLLDHGLYQQLTDDFRMTYCKLWDGLMRKDMDAIRIHCLSLNAGDLYPLLACMISARTWNSIERGITKASRSNTEVGEIGSDVVNYFSEITQLLDKVPSQLLLILKTNDLLRSIDHTLQSSSHTHSFITMSKVCIETIGEEERKWAESLRGSVRAVMMTKWKLFLLYLFEWWVWLRPHEFQ